MINKNVSDPFVLFHRSMHYLFYHYQINRSYFKHLFFHQLLKFKYTVNQLILIFLFTYVH